jgi:iron complex outermembrane receptor protein
MKKKLYRSSLLPLSLTYILSQQVYAETNQEDKVHTLDAINVDAEHDLLSDGQIIRKNQVGILGNKDTLDIPFSITGYSSKYIEDHQVKSVAQALASEPSVRNIFPDNALGEYFNIRGLYTQSHELAWNGLFGLVPNNRMPTAILERVEVLRGTSALLYGMSLGGAVGGVINVVPKYAHDEPLTRITTSYFSDSNIGAHVDFGRRFGQNKEYGIRINALKSHGDTSLDDQTENRLLGSIALDYRGTQLRASLDAYSIKEELDGGMPLMVTFATSDIPKAPDPSINHLPDGYSVSRTKAVIGGVEYDFNKNWTVYAKAGIKRQEGQGNLNNAIGISTQANGDYSGMYMTVHNYYDSNSAEAGLRGELFTGKIKHNIVLSGSLLEQEYAAVAASRGYWQSNLYAPQPATIVATPSKPPKQNEIELRSVALADTVSFLDNKYQLILGLRQQQVKSKSFTTSGEVSGTPYDEDALTPAIGIVVKPWSRAISLYANYIEGLSQGTTVSDATATNYGETFAPYKSKQYEIGTKWEIGNFRNTLSFYQIKVPSLLSQDNGDNTVTYSVNGEQRNRGIEWTTAGEVIKNIMLVGGIAYMDAEYSKTASGLYDGNDAIGIPHWQANLGVDWNVTQVPNLTLSANTIYTGSSYTNNTNTQKVSGWTRLDVAGRYTSTIAHHAVTFRAGVDNVFDKHYWSGVRSGYANTGAPRSYKLSLQIDF